jgi:tetratricopeptide (TPR) repeat protein
VHTACAHLLFAIGAMQVAPSVGTPHVAPDHAASLTWRARGTELAYNLDYEQAAVAYQQAAALDPDDPAVHRLLASATWMKLLFDRGAILVEDYLGQAKAEFKRDPPPPDRDRFFHAEIDRSLALAEARLAGHPRDVDAHYQAGATSGFLASYTATVEGRLLASMRAARRAVDEHERVLQLDPSRVDAGFIVGTYRYAVSTLSLPLRVLARLAGFSGGRDHALALIETAARQPSDVQSDALFALTLIYNREQRYDDAQKTIARLRERYPRNRLLWLEAGSTALRAGRSLEARAAFETGMRMLDGDPRPRAFGEEARWKLMYGKALVLLRDLEPARRELQASLASTAPDWVHGRATVELGKIDDFAGSRASAVALYRRAVTLCEAGRDDSCVEEARTLARTPYRGGAL